MNIHDEQDAYAIHDGRIILDVNAAFCRLFRCEREQMVNRSLFDVIVDKELKVLGGLRMEILVELQRQHLPDVRYNVARCDDSIFWVDVQTRVHEAGTYRSRITYLYEEWP